MGLLNVYDHKRAVDPLAEVDAGGVPHPDKASGGFRLKPQTGAKTIREKSMCLVKGDKVPR